MNVAGDRWLWCATCGEGTPRDGRSWYCRDCRLANRRAKKAQAQRARRAALRGAPDVEALVADVYTAADTLGQYLKRAQAFAAEQGRPLTAPQ